MMVYLIGSLIKYRSDDGVMWLAADENSAITLTVTMNRMLWFILSRQGQVVSRDEILDSVWDAHGLISSNNTLNKYISEIRKKFVLFGLEDECITTVPKIGFIFNSEIDVQVLPDDNNIDPDENKTPVSPPITEITNQRGKRQFYVPLLLALSLIIPTLSFLIHENYFSTNKKVTNKEVNTFFLFNFDTCPVYTTQKNSQSLSELKKDIFINMASDVKVSCLPGATFLYQVSETYLYGDIGRVYISRCTTGKKGFISCLNYYWSGYEKNE